MRVFALLPQERTQNIRPRITKFSIAPSMAAALVNRIRRRRLKGMRQRIKTFEKQHRTLLFFSRRISAPRQVHVQNGRAHDNASYEMEREMREYSSHLMHEDPEVYYSEKRDSSRGRNGG